MLKLKIKQQVRNCLSPKKDVTLTAGLENAVYGINISIARSHPMLAIVQIA
jgi:hypothetical protein